MKRFKVLILVVMFFAVMVFTPSLFSKEKVVKKAPCSKVEKASYTCPMAACKTFSDKEGKCPKCGMELKKIDKKDCAKKCDAKKVHKKCAKDCKKACCAKKDLKKCHVKKDCAKKCDVKKAHKADKKCAKDCKKACCVKKEVKKEKK